MANIFFLVLRRMRLPLVVLISVYSVATIGMTLIPGVTPEGETWHMGFFHAFYFVSFMGTTIGFGEIPYEFTDTQRSWVLVCIYTSVISWLYGIGSLLRLVQDETFVQAVAKRNFDRSINRIDESFYIICGYGETGELINRGLCNIGIQTVIIDRDSERIASLQLLDFGTSPIAVTADITDPNNLVNAGINNPHCQGVIAVTNDDHTNLQVAVASKLVNQSVKVICRSEVEDEARNMASFGTDVIFNPYLTFARRLEQLTTKPHLHRIQNWFINQYAHADLTSEVEQKGLPSGNWIICGYGRFGKAVFDAIADHVDKVSIIAPDPIACGAPDHAIVGRGTEADTLLEAEIMSARVIVAASEDDANNLSTIMTAKQLQKDIVCIARVNKESSKHLFKHAQCDYVMRRSQVVANEALTSISRPLVTKFIRFSSSLTDNETAALAKRIMTLTGGKEPVTWRLQVDKVTSPELVKFIQSGNSVDIGDVCENSRVESGKCIPLLLFRSGVSKIMPAKEELLQIGDQLLVCGARDELLLPQRLQHNIELLDTLINKNEKHIPLLRWLARR